MGFLTAAIGLFTIIYALGGSTISPLFLGWMLILAAIAQFIFAFNSQAAGNFIAMVSIGVLYALAGIALEVFALPGVVTLTSVIGVMLILEAMLDTIIAFALPAMMRSRGWFLFSALATLLLGTAVLRDWPKMTDWAAAGVLGVAMLIDGATRFAMTSRNCPEL